MTVTGTVRQANDAAVGSNTTLHLEGSAAGSLISGNILNSAGGRLMNVSKAGTGDWALNGTGNAFTGTILFSPTTTSAGTLSYASASGTNPITFNTTTSTATLKYTGAAPLTMSGAITASALTTGTITLDASGTGTGAINYSNTGSLGSAASGIKNLVLTGTNTGDNTLAGQWVNNGSSAATLTKSGDGTWVLANAGNSYTGATTISGGTLAVSKLADGSSNSSIGASTNAATNLLIGNGATLRYIGAGGDSTNRNFTITGTSATLDASGIGNGAVTFNGTPSYSTANQVTTLNLIGTSTGLNTLAANLADNGSGALTVSKDGDGTWVLTGNSTYTGGTNVNGGTLLVNGASTASNFTVNDGGTLGGTGTITGNVVVNDGGIATGTLGMATLQVNSGGTVSPGNSPGLETPGTFDMNPGGTYLWEINRLALDGGSAGNDPGWDLYEVAVLLDIDDLDDSNKFIIEIIDDTVGNTLSAPGKNQTLTWNIIDLIGSATISKAFSSNYFTLDTDDLGPAWTGIDWDIYQEGSSIFLSAYNIPEPSTMLLAGLGLAGLTLRRRRRTA